jgi:hypothetical protein
VRGNAGRSGAERPQIRTEPVKIPLDAGGPGKPIPWARKERKKRRKGGRRASGRHASRAGPHQRIAICGALFTSWPQAYASTAFGRRGSDCIHTSRSLYAHRPFAAGPISRLTRQLPGLSAPSPGTARRASPLSLASLVVPPGSSSRPTRR